MESHKNILLAITIYFSFISSISSCCHNNETPKIKGMFVFGSSLVDNGNNNDLPTLAKANYSPYGVDFVGGPTGRFNNGKNVIDLIAEKINLPYFIPPFTDPDTKGDKIVHGVDFASGGSGILDSTGSVTGKVISLNEQIRNLETVTIPELKNQIGCSNNSTSILSNYLFVIGSGGNDYTLNYFLKPTQPLEAFTSTVITTFSGQLKKLYSLGARKFVIIGMNPNGCTPVVKAKYPLLKGCLEVVNQAAQLFNYKLRNLLDSIKVCDMPEANLIFFDAYKVITDIIQFPTPLGFEVTDKACCEVDKGGASCKKDGTICENRSKYLFFDGLHPTEAVNIVQADKAFSSLSQTDVYPINIQQLIQI